jgi:protoporphyrinogen oxidase
MTKSTIAIIGAGPAGLGVAYELSQQGIKSIVFDKNDDVGGLARTKFYKDYYFDIGPHRFYTKNERVKKLWQEILGDDFKKVKRLTRIYYDKKFFNYPIQAGNVLRGLGLKQILLAGFSYLNGKLSLLGRKPQNFEEWMIKNFGRKLYNIFFKTYTEKVWGIPCRDLGAEWANQRIKNLDLWQVIKNTFTKKTPAKSLVEGFYYPTAGAGMFYQRLKNIIESRGSKIFLNTAVKKIYHQNQKIQFIEVESEGQRKKIAVDYLFSSAPITFLIKSLSPAPMNIVASADKLYYRDHITVNLIINRHDIFPDQWLYVHDPELKMARIANYANFSSIKSSRTPLSVEYFVFTEKDELWKADDQCLIKLAASELEKMGLIKIMEVIDGFVVREKDSYPVYYTGYQSQFEILKNYLSQFSNLQLVGRAGMYKYNNQDHALLTGLLAARNFLGEKNDIWSINTEDEYLEIKGLPLNNARD